MRRQYRQRQRERVVTMGGKICFLLIFMTFFMVGCGGDDNSPTAPLSLYNFNGTWVIAERVTYDPYGMAGIGETASNNFVLTQNGANLTMTLTRLGWVFTGTCDPNAKTFAVSRIDQGVTHRYSGTGTDANTMTTESVMEANGTVYVRFKGTATLQSRATSKVQKRGSQLQTIFERLKNL